MDAEASCESSDLRRERNKQAILEFKSETLVAALYVHYLAHFGEALVASSRPLKNWRVGPGSARMRADDARG